MFTLDNQVLDRLDEQVRIYGIRAVLKSVTLACDVRAEAAVKEFNTLEAKQWAAWSVAIEALANSPKLTDPGRDDPQVTFR